LKLAEVSPGHGNIIAQPSLCGSESLALMFGKP
jgi:hypothetical protein